ncbi:hypothetical protein G7084_02790 [Weissella coleopterorum]|uniref:Uncharacterized protein n=1 Tax=Weissella coleopterorum TaxID=2714949 RepID=A0A6G8AZB2_9LACO|nr:hypothetical protein [Weissella coleopterorum]QIL50346.1 hypothetical protein G7084_02790 [Weissella coleopterorum]
MCYFILHQTQATKQYGSSWVTDQNGHTIYFLRGQLSQYYYQLQIHDAKNMFLAEIKQLNTGIIPRFKIQSGERQLGSFGLALPMHEVIYIKRLNWVVFAHPKQRAYYIFKGRQVLLHSSLNQHQQLEINITQSKQQALLILIIAFLDRYQQTMMPLTLTQKLQLNYQQLALNPTFNPQFKSKHPVSSITFKSGEYHL